MALLGRILLGAVIALLLAYLLIRVLWIIFLIWCGITMLAMLVTFLAVVWALCRSWDD